MLVKIPEDRIISNKGSHLTAFRLLFGSAFYYQSLFMQVIVDRPLFVVGMPRSGSTALHDVLARHPAFSTTTNITRKFPTCYPALKLVAAFSKRHDPGEAGTMWDRFVRGDTDVLTASDVTPAARRFYMRAASNVLRLYGGDRFLTKCPRNGLRMDFLKAIFPDARFLHLIRDGRAVAQSIMERRKRSGNLQAWWDVKPDGWRQWEHLPPVAAVAHQWNAVIQYMEVAGAAMPSPQFMEVRYEDLLENPVSFVQRIMDFCEMTWADADIRQATGDIGSRGDKWRKAFSVDELDLMMSIMGGTMRRHGYTD